MKCQKFIETARLIVAGGKGGNGCAGFRREKFIPRGGPDGGNGGNGGNVLMQADGNVSSLIGASFSPRRQARDGGNGKGKNLHGRNGEDLVIKVPCGTEVWNDSDDCLLGDLVEDPAKLTVARGGKGGQGNGSWKQGSARSIDESTPGEPGQQKVVRLELKIIADAGLVGLPNAGKSSLLSAISHARPRVAPFPFTTLRPVLGTVKYETYTDLTVVDIPGLIRDASRGAGLGHKFLRHVERARHLVFVIDMAASDGRNPAEDYFVLLNELRLHDRSLLERPSIVVANKMDLPEANEKLDEFERLTGRKPMLISTITRQGVNELKRELYDAILKPDSVRRSQD